MFAGLGAAYHQPAAEKFLIVQLCHGALRFLDGLHLYERKSFRALVVTVTYHLGILNVANSVEQFEEIALGRFERQIANVQTRGSDFNPFRFARRSRRLSAVARSCWGFRSPISEKCGNPLPECFFRWFRFYTLTRLSIAFASGTAVGTVRASPG